MDAIGDTQIAVTSGLPHTLQELPPELWITIFLYTLPSSHEAFDAEKLEITDAHITPIVLASVCRLWRNLTCNAPQLWETCYLSYRNPQLNHIWIDRAGTRGLRLYGSCARGSSFASDGELESAGHDESKAAHLSILPYIRRWKSIRIIPGPFLGQIESAEWLSLLGAGFNWDAPLLEVFKIETPFGSRSTKAPSWVAPLVSNAPSIRELKLFDIKELAINQNRFPHLIDVEIESIDLTEALDLLRGLPILQKFTAAVDCHETDPTPLTALVHDSLIHLHDQGEWRGEEDGLTMFSFLTLPSLSTFQAAYDMDFAFADFLDLLKRSKCRLKSLGFDNVQVDRDGLLRILKHETVDLWLESLEFKNCGVISHDIVRFLRYDPEAPRLRRLERISMKGPRLMMDTPGIRLPEPRDGILADIIASRFGGLARYNDTTMAPANLRYFAVDFIMKFLHTLDLARIAPLSRTVDPSEGDTCLIELVLLYSKNREPGKDYLSFVLKRPGSGEYIDDDLHPTD